MITFDYDKRVPCIVLAHLQFPLLTNTALRAINNCRTWPITKRTKRSWISYKLIILLRIPRSALRAKNLCRQRNAQDETYPKSRSSAWYRPCMQVCNTTDVQPFGCGSSSLANKKYNQIKLQQQSFVLFAFLARTVPQRDCSHWRRIYECAARAIKYATDSGNQIKTVGNQYSYTANYQSFGRIATSSDFNHFIQRNCAFKNKKKQIEYFAFATRILHSVRQCASINSTLLK